MRTQPTLVGPQSSFTSIPGANAVKTLTLTSIVLFLMSSICAGDPTLVSSTFTGVLTYHNNNARTGLNAAETVLTLKNVNVHQFGKLRSPFLLDGDVHAQPLYVTGATVNGSVHNVVYVVTDHDSVYAFDADGKQPSSTQPWLWKVTCIVPHGSPCKSGGPASNVSTVPCQDLVSFGLPCQIPNETGIIATPVIAPSSHTMYLVARTRETTSVNSGANCLPVSSSEFHCYYFQMHALDITTGGEKTGSPVVIQYSGSLSLPSFDAIRQYNRSALLLANGNVYVAFGSRGDLHPYTGWIFAFTAASLTPATAMPFVSAPLAQSELCADNSTIDDAGGIWSVGALAADSTGQIYLATGQGVFDGSSNFSDSVLKLSGTTLTVADFFTPFNENTLACSDWDAGSGSSILLPAAAGNSTHPNLMMVGTKEGEGAPTNSVQGRLYLIDRDNMGKHSNFSDNIVQELIGSTSQPYLMFNAPAYWNNMVYMGVAPDTFSMSAAPVSLLAFGISNAMLSSKPLSQTAAEFIFSGGNPSISANGISNGIVWALSRSHKDPVTNITTPGMLHAFNASNLSAELYNSSMNSTDALAGDVTSFTLPTIANGKVYVTVHYFPVSKAPAKGKLYLFGPLSTPR